MTRTQLPEAQGLYDPANEHDSCGVGFLADLQGRKTHEIVSGAIQILANLEHRGACGCEENTGDGAGILVQIPHNFLLRECTRLGFSLPAPGEYGVGLVYLPREEKERLHCEKTLADIVAAKGQKLLGWRDVPTDNSDLGNGARSAEPVMRQIFIGRGKLPNHPDGLAFERMLYVIRKKAENAIRTSDLAHREMFYICSLSCKTLIYKGMLNAPQLGPYFADLRDPEFVSALALVHSRFSTNTFPTWPRAHPYRYICHNGEINTVRGNVNWMRAREHLLRSDLFGEDLKEILPVIDPTGSDSAMFDNALELLVLGGRSLPHAVMMMIPEPWSGDENMDPARRAFYEFHSCLMEPWDGPASIAFTDGIKIGAILDRNGLRPSRYYVTKDDLVIMASEVGVLDVAPEQVKLKGRLQPGRMFLCDLEEHRIIEDGEIKSKIAAEHPYREWLSEHIVTLYSLPVTPPPPDTLSVLLRQQAFGYTSEDLKILLAPMGLLANEAVGSMGNDSPLAVLSDRPQLLYGYFKQLFAQVTNPPVDCIREEVIMSMETTIGSEYNLLQPTPRSARQVELHSPILLDDELDRLRGLDGTNAQGFRSITLPILYSVKDGAAGLKAALDELFRKATQAVKERYEFLILSDRGLSDEMAPIPALLAVAGVHHHLIREGTRTQVGLVLESGEPREVHHFALLIGYGAGAISPYLAFATLGEMVHNGELKGVEAKKAKTNFAKAVAKGVMKVMSKMGISTVQSYCGAQIFEAIGLDKDLVETYFTGTSSRISGIGLDTIAAESLARHRRAFPDRPMNGHTLDVGGHYQFRREGEYHLFNPETIHKLQYACRNANYPAFKEYSALVDDQSRRMCTLRGLFQLKLAATPIPLEEVEPIESITRRFKSGAMSYGSISQEAHETLAIAMNRVGGRSNTGEGGEDPERYTWTNERGDSKNSAIKQVASARFGVTSEYLVSAKEIQIKMAQGAKPGEGGQLPGSKVYPWIAKVRHSTPGVGLISPPPHHDIYSIEDLAELIHDLKNANPQARISVKLVAEVGVGTVAAGVSKAHADVVLISGHDGGTGASPLTSIKHAGAPWELGLAETQQTLLLNGLRSRIVVEVDGQLKTGRDVIVGALLGAEEFGFATAPLVSLGCIMMRVCHLNTCPVGVATQDPRLRKKFTGDPEHAANFMRFIAQEVREWMAKLGVRSLDEIIGRSDLLDTGEAVEKYRKASGLNLKPIFYQPEISPAEPRHCTQKQEHGLEKSLDARTLIPLCAPALEHGTPVESPVLEIRNVNRVVGTTLGSLVTRKYGSQGLPEDTIRLRFKGSAGQSFGAFVPNGITLRLEGDANDYVGKGLSGGKLIVVPPEGSTFVPSENVIIGNVAFYGATGGEAYIRGMAGERFCVRNSGVTAVVQAVGDHGCEYMTGGRVVVLGPTGKNFAAGMSGGIAYVLDESNSFEKNCNKEMVALFRVEDPEEAEELRGLIQKHADYTGSERSAQVLKNWDRMVKLFVKVYPNDYRRVLETQKRYRLAGHTDEEAVMAAFAENAGDAARVGGK
jgi:glutamate synthase domain-containing protein 2/glutamate synthase domain-containing protein 1/glutamate synthase domain-containing protein 3